MESIYVELALCGRKNDCARPDSVLFPKSEVSDGTVSLDFFVYFLFFFIILSCFLGF